MPNDDIIEKLEPASESINAENLLNDIKQFLEDHALLPNGASTAMVLWFFATYAINCFRIFPKLTIYSPEKRCGKSTVLDLIEAFCFKPLIVSNISSAAIFRFIEGYQPTLIIDEADTFVKNGSSEMVGIINSGHAKRRANIIRASGEDFRPQKFTTWTPMALASIGKLQPTIMDRSIVVPLERKKVTDAIKTPPVDLFEIAQPTREDILKWAIDNESDIKSKPITPPNLGNDRAVDNWLPLFTIANLVSPAWAKKCEEAYRQLTQVEDDPADSTLLLSDIRKIFKELSSIRISSEALVDELADIEDHPWCEYRNGRPITKNGLANLLKTYNIKPKAIRVEGKSVRGYDLSWFQNAFSRYLP